MNDNKFDGYKLFEVRKKKKLSQAKLAELIGVSRQTIYLWESNQTKPDIEKVSKLCKVLEVDMSELISGMENTSIKPNGAKTEIAEENNNDIQNFGVNNFAYPIKIKSKKSILTKVIIIIVVIILLIYISISTVKFVRLNKVLNEWKRMNQIDDYYIEIQEYLINESDSNITLENYFYEKYYHKGVLTTIVKDRKNEKIVNKVICDYNKGLKYIIYDDTKTYVVQKIDNKKSGKILSNFYYLSQNFKTNKLINYFKCFFFNFNIIKKNGKYEFILNDRIKEVIKIKDCLLEYEETLDNDLRKYKRYYYIELNSDKDFEIDLSDYTEIE